MTDDHERAAAGGATVKDDDQGGGLVLVASGNGAAGPWSYWWPAAEWAALDQVERAKVKRRARSRYARPAGDDRA